MYLYNFSHQTMILKLILSKSFLNYETNKQTIFTVFELFAT